MAQTKTAPPQTRLDGELARSEYLQAERSEPPSRYVRPLIQ